MGQNVNDYQKVVTAKEIRKGHTELLVKGTIKALKEEEWMLTTAKRLKKQISLR